jgi:hypothetical protein
VSRVGQILLLVLILISAYAIGIGALLSQT